MISSAPCAQNCTEEEATASLGELQAADASLPGSAEERIPFLESWCKRLDLKIAKQERQLGASIGEVKVNLHFTAWAAAAVQLWHAWIRAMMAALHTAMPVTAGLMHSLVARGTSGMLCAGLHTRAATAAVQHTARWLLCLLLAVVRPACCA